MSPLAKIARASLALLPLLLGCGAAAPVSPTPRPELAADDRAPRLCARGPTTRGVDVSYYQGHVDWPEARRAGVEFAFARVSDGAGFVDPELGANWTGMKAAGVVRGAYQFFRPTEDPRTQADLLLAELKKHGGLEPGDIPPALDVEVADGVAEPILRARIQVWLDRVESVIGRTPLVYTAPGFWDDLGADAGFGRYSLWVANWETTCPRVPTSWQAWRFWQHGDQGSIPGIDGAVDLDRFDGSLADLRAFTGATFPQARPVAPPPPPSDKLIKTAKPRVRRPVWPWSQVPKLLASVLP